MLTSKISSELLKINLANPIFKNKKNYNIKAWENELNNSKNKEKKRRLEYYTAFNIFNIKSNFFDIMTKDTFDIFIKAKYITKLFNLNIVTSEILLITILSGKQYLNNLVSNKLFKLLSLKKLLFYQTFIENNLPHMYIVERFFNKITLIRWIYNLYFLILLFFNRIYGFFIENLTKQIINFKRNILKIDFIRTRIKDFLKTENGKKFRKFYLNLFKRDSDITSYNFSLSCLYVIYKASINAIVRFKRCIITPDIILLTLLEEKTTKAFSFFLTKFENKKNFLNIRLYLIKQIYIENRKLKKNHELNLYIYEYYLNKYTLSHSGFKNLIPVQNRSIYIDKIFNIRKKFFTYIISHDKLKYLKKQIQQSLKANILVF